MTSSKYDNGNVGFELQIENNTTLKTLGKFCIKEKFKNLRIITSFKDFLTEEGFTGNKYS